MSHRSRLGGLAAVVVMMTALSLALLRGLLPDSVVGQFDIPGFGGAKEPAAAPRPQNSIVLSEDRDKSRTLAMVRSRLKLKRYADVARQLGQMLADPATNDFFLLPDGSNSRRSFKYELRRLIASLPPEGRESYETQFGPAAKKLLDAAIEAGDVGQLQSVARRYPHTQAGYQACFLLGTVTLDQGRPDESFEWLQQLRELPGVAARFEPELSFGQAMAAHLAGSTDLAEKTLLALKKRDPDATWTFGGKPRPLFADDAKALEWLVGIVGPGVQAITPRALVGSVPQMRSRHPEVRVTELTRELLREREQVRGRKETPLPMLHPVGVEDIVLIRSAVGVRAISLTTGEVAWKYPDAGDGGGIDQLIWREAAFGRISTDERSAFLIEGAYRVSTDVNTGMAPVMMWRGGGMFGGPFGGAFGGWVEEEATALPSGSRNRLTSIDIAKEGKIRWQVGGVDGGGDRKLAGAFFLGPPTVAGGRLYVMAEIRSSIHLAVLDKNTGRLVWLQKLADVENPIDHDPFRRMAGASPVVASGIVVCPTSYGGVVAVDVPRRSLLWAYQHTRRQNTIYHPDQGQLPNLAQGGRWADNSLLVAEGRVVITPLESDEIHCLDLKTGRRLWKDRRGASLFVACIHQGNVIFVDGRYMNAKKLSDGKTKAWKESLQLPDERRPSGRGVHSGNDYYLPLTDANGGYKGGGQIVRVDLVAGKITESVSSQRDFVPGNLAFHNGVFISQSPEYLEIFDQRGVLEKRIRRRLAENARDAEAWARLADLKRSLNKLPEAIEHLRKAYNISPTPAIRNAYALILLDGIDAKLPNQAELVAELGRLAK